MDPALQELLLRNVNPDEEIEAIIRLTKPGEIPPAIRLVTTFGDVITCRVKRKNILSTYDHPSVKSLKASRIFSNECNCHTDEQGIVIPGEGATPPFQEFSEKLTGEGTVIGIIDWGADFAHADFINDNGTTRFIALWDQAHQQNALSPQPFGYGKVYSRDRINQALSAAEPYKALGYHPAVADNLGTGSHGTHVMGIAAANGRSGVKGIASAAEIIFVHLAANDTDGMYNLGDSVRILEAIDFIHRMAGNKPLVMNLSVGKHGGPHDGSTLVEIAMDHFLENNDNRHICQSTGNYFNSNTHASGMVRPGQSTGLSFDIDKTDKTPNEIEIWYSGKDSFELEITDHSKRYRFSCSLGDTTPIEIAGHIAGRIYHRKTDPNNQKNHIDIFLYEGIPAETWTIKLTGKKIVDGRFDAWIERDGACPHCQTKFNTANIIKTCTTNTICNGFNSIVTGAYDETAAGIPEFSSSGPTVDGRIKPNILSPGVRIRSSRSSPQAQQRGGNDTVVMSGTSMASPRVTGTVALIMGLLKDKPQPFYIIRNLLLNSCTKAPESFDTARSGYGILNIEQALQDTIKFINTGPAKNPSTNKSSTTFNEDSADIFPGHELATPCTCGIQDPLDDAWGEEREYDLQDLEMLSC